MSEKGPEMLAVMCGGAEPEDVSVSDLALPIPHSGEALVRVDAAGLNPYDLSLTTGLPPRTRLAMPPGRDLAGTVVEGPNALVGKRVWATGGEFGRRRPGFHADYVVLPVEALTCIPAQLTAEQAATVGVAFSTAWWALVEISPLRGVGGAQSARRPLRQQRVIITGAAGSVGGAAVQLARWLGAQQLWALGREGQTPPAGPTDGFFTDPDDLAQAAQEHGGATMCLDVVGGAMFDALLPAMSRGGRLAVIASPGAGRADFDLRRFYRNELALHGVSTGARDVYQNARLLRHLAPGFADGSLQPLPVTATFLLTEAPHAYQQLADHPPGKIVFRPSGQ
jgi:NADPH2:quinone reductase